MHHVHTIGAFTMPSLRHTMLALRSVCRLVEENRPALLAHLLMLSSNDRWLRFGSSMSDRMLARYVEGIDLVNGAAFAVYCSDTVLCGAAHVALAGGIAELGMSVLENHRRRGHGAALFARAMTWARTRGVNIMRVHYLVANAAAMHIASKAGMHVTISRGEADAHLALAPA